MHERQRHVVFGVITVGVGLSSLLAGQAAPKTEPMPATQVILLGSGTPYPDPEHQGPATAVVVGSRTFLFDAGAGVERQMKAANLAIDGPTALFITHLHSDHTLGYPDLILTSWLVGRSLPLRAYGPPGLAAMTDHLLKAWSEDIEIRTQGLEHRDPNGYRVDVHEIASGVVYDDQGVRVTAIPVQHGSWPVAFAYRVDTPGRSIVISGDTRPSPAILEAARDVDVLVHEVHIHGRVAPQSRPGGESWPEYMRTFHTSDLELGKLAAQAKPKLLLLTHVGLHGGTVQELISGIREGGFEGEVIVGTDLGRY